MSKEGHLFLSATRLGAVLIVTGLMGALTTPMPAGATRSSFPTALIAQDALTHKWHWGGSCFRFARNMVIEASGGTVSYPPIRSLNGGYYKPYKMAGADRQTLASAAEGDILQLYKASDPKSYHRGMHTAIVVKNLGRGSFNVVDTNWRWDEVARRQWDGIVLQHNWLNVPRYAAERGLTYAIWRFGVSDLHASVASLSNDP